jgi:hypothetical protein
MTVNQAGATVEIQLNTSTRAFASQLPALREIIATWMWITAD